MKVAQKAIKKAKTSVNKFSRVNGKQMKNWGAMGSEQPVNPSKQPKGTVFGAKIK